MRGPDFEPRKVEWNGESGCSGKRFLRVAKDNVTCPEDNEKDVYCRLRNEMQFI